MLYHITSDYAIKASRVGENCGATLPPLLILVLKERKNGWGAIFSWGDLSLEGCGTLPQNSSKPSKEYEKLHCKNHISSHAVSEILRYKQTRRKKGRDSVTLL